MIRGRRWQTVKEILDAALDLDPSDLPGFLARACGDDDLLRRQVESLLAAQKESQDFLMRPVFSLRGAAAGERRSDAGLRAGSYELRSELGRGGMGTVWLARRADGELERQVAVKILKRGMDTDEIVGRFQAERQILADLDHPFVARFLDGGSTADGRPYVVMEHVEGQPIDRYCDDRRLSIRERLRLFRKVCAAVQFAHQNLVVHRDLKPANILITRRGEPKLLDFGIAKLLKTDSHRCATATALGTAPLSPPYASPEQVRGGPINTASDVYSLGVVLYELLTGHPPYRFDTLRPEQVARVICEQTPTRPSTAVRRTEGLAAADGPPELTSADSVGRARSEDRTRLGRRLRGDLDTIVLKALRKEPERRFASVEQLSEDLRRHLEGLPIRSRRATFAYRTGKFLRRHALGAATAAIFVALILAFAITMTLQRQQISGERDRAETVTEFLVEFLRAPDPKRARGETVTVLEALDAGVERLDEQLAAEPEIRAALLDAIGRVYGNLALDNAARPLLETALELRRDSFGEDHVLVAESLHNLANVVDDAQQAESLRRRALAVQRRAYPHGHVDLARGLNNLAISLHRSGQLASAEELAREALEMKLRLAGEADSSVAVAMNTLAGVLSEQGEAGEAESLYRRSIDSRRQLDGPVDPGLAATLNNLAVLRTDRGDVEEAIELYRESLEIRRKLYRGDHPRLVSGLKNLGALLASDGDPQAAIGLLEEALAMQRRLAGDAGLMPALIKKHLALTAAAGGDFDSCLALVDEALTQLGSQRRIAEAESIRAGCLAGQGHYAAAEPILLRSYRILAGTPGLRAHQVRQARSRVVALYEDWGRPAEAARYRRRN